MPKKTIPQIPREQPKNYKAKTVTRKKATAEDLSDQFDSFETFLMKNWKVIAGCFALILVVVLIVCITAEVQKRSDMKARTAFANAASEDELVEALDQYGSKNIAAAARLRLAGMYADHEKYPEAAEQLRLVSEDSGADWFIRARAALDAGYLCEKAGKNDEALKLYNTVSSNMDMPEALQAEASYAQTCVLLSMNKEPEALEALGKINQTRIGSLTDPEYAYWAQKAQTLENRIQSGKAAVSEKAL